MWFCVIDKNTVDEWHEPMVQWLRQHRNQGTSKAYATYQNKFKRWCLENNRVYMPATPVTVVAFMKYHAENGYAASTISKIIPAANC